MKKPRQFGGDEMMKCHHHLGGNSQTPSLFFVAVIGDEKNWGPDFMFMLISISIIFCSSSYVLVTPTGHPLPMKVGPKKNHDILKHPKSDYTPEI